MAPPVSSSKPADSDGARLYELLEGYAADGQIDSDEAKNAVKGSKIWGKINPKAQNGVDHFFIDYCPTGLKLDLGVQDKFVNGLGLSRETFQKCILPTPPPEKPKEKGVKVVALVGDEQIHVLPDFQGFYRSLLGNSLAPAHRLPASTLGVTHALEALLRESIPEDQKEIFEGLVATGDIADVANTEEIKVYFEALDRLKKADPIYRSLLFMIGNHEIFHAGVSNSGFDFAGLLYLILRSGGTEAYKKDIRIPEVGDRKKVLDKKVMIDLIYRYFFDKEPDPAEIATSSYQEYSLKKGDITKWDDTSQVFHDFWKQEKDGSWNTVVHYLPGKKSKPERQWFYASAVKLDDFETSGGVKTPVYFLQLDTMDYLMDGASLGALQGHVSYIQVKIAQAFIDQVRAAEPGAKFVFGGHFPVKGGSFGGFDFAGIKKITDSGLYRLLSDEDVVAYIAAHTHDRGYADLAEMKPIDRVTPLPQITVPAVMDYPNEMVLFKYGVEESDPSKLVFQFDFTGLDEEKIPGSDEAVCKELKYIRPHLLMYDDGILHIKDDRIREFATPGTPLLKRADIALNLDTGILPDFARAHDQIIMEDVIPAMVEDTQFYLRAFMSIVKLSLIDAGMEEEALKLEKIYLKNLDHLNNNYEKIWRGEYTEATGPHSEIHALDRYMTDLDQAVLDFKKTVETELASGTLDPKQKEHLEYAAHLLPLVKGYVGEYRYWLENYERKLRTEREARDFIYDANLGGSFYFKAVMKHIREVPDGSALALIRHMFFEAGEQRVEFYGGEKALVKKVPDRIRIELSPSSGARQVILSPLTEEDKKVKRLDWCDPDIPHYAEEGRETAQASVKPTGDRGFEWHWSYRLGNVWQGSTLDWDWGKSYPLAGEIGGQMHLLNQWNRPRLNLDAHLGGTADFNGYWDVYGKLGFEVGDPWGLLEVGPTVKGGFVLSSPTDPTDPIDSFIGVGGSVSVFEGLLSFEASKMWYDEGPNDWRYFFNVDLFAAARAGHWSGLFNWVDRDF